MKPALLILDPAHGIDVPGKQSPDGNFHEWEWSRMMIHKIMAGLINPDYPFEVLCPFLSFDIEPGLSNRVKEYNQEAEKYKDTLMLSIHVDAYHGEWWNGTGFSFFTSTQEDFSDRLANVMAHTFERAMPGERIRRRSQTDASKDENFTVLAGYGNLKPKYHGILVENMFMDSRIDIVKLTDPIWQDRLARAYQIAVINMFDYMNHRMDTIPKPII